MGQIPQNIPAAENRKSNDVHSHTTVSNKSPQTPQAASQDYPSARSETAGASIIAGAGSSARRIMNGKLGKPYGRG
jgi:hypothetical protein